MLQITLTIARPSNYLNDTAAWTIKPFLLISIAALTSACSSSDVTPNDIYRPSASIEVPMSPPAAAPVRVQNPEGISITDTLITEPISPVATGTALPEIQSASEFVVDNTVTDTVDSPDVTQANCTAHSSVMQQRTVQLINRARAASRNCGTEHFAATRPLIWNSALATAATNHSRDMAAHNFFSHTGSDGSSASVRVTNAGYTWRTVGENIAAGRETASASVNDWLESPGHCSNIMNPAFTEVSVSCVEDSSSDYRYYWTNVMATPM